jgi:hypothetical protein
MNIGLAAWPFCGWKKETKSWQLDVAVNGSSSDSHLFALSSSLRIYLHHTPYNWMPRKWSDNGSKKNDPRLGTNSRRGLFTQLRWKDNQQLPGATLQYQLFCILEDWLSHTFFVKDSANIAGSFTVSIRLFGSMSSEYILAQLEGHKWRYPENLNRLYPGAGEPWQCS